MIKLILNRILFFIGLMLLVLSLSWVDRLTIQHIMSIPIYVVCMPFFWVFLDWATGVNRER